LFKGVQGMYSMDNRIESWFEKKKKKMAIRKKKKKCRRSFNPTQFNHSIDSL